MIALFPQEERAFVVALVKSLFTPKTGAWEKGGVRLILMLSDIPKEERAFVVNLAKSLFTPEMDADDKRALIWEIAETPAEERESVFPS